MSLAFDSIQRFALRSLCKSQNPREECRSVSPGRVKEAIPMIITPAPACIEAPYARHPWISHAGTNEALALPALKRVIRVETLSRSSKALLPPHKCGGSHHQFRTSLAESSPARSPDYSKPLQADFTKRRGASGKRQRRAGKEKDWNLGPHVSCPPIRLRAALSDDGRSLPG